MKYVKKPIVVEAFQFGVDEMPDWCLGYQHGKWKIPKGDFIIKGSHGEIYPCKEDIFKEIYRPYEEDDYTFAGRYQEKFEPNKLTTQVTNIKRNGIGDHTVEYIISKEAAE